MTEATAAALRTAAGEGGTGDFPVVGVVGGGQLARMMQQPAVALGVRLRLLADSAEDSAAQVIPDTVIGDYRDLDTLRSFAPT